jgi:ABC-type spermidine/putrescine transport system permease subunit II
MRFYRELFYRTRSRLERLSGYPQAARCSVRIAFLPADRLQHFAGVLGTFMAYVLANYRFRGREALSVMVNLPVAIPTGPSRRSRVNGQ